MPCLTFERRMPVQPLFVALAAAVACGLARADEPSPYFIGVTQALTHDSNINRIPNGTSDNYSSTGIVAGLDQRIGRQRVYASAGLRHPSQLLNTRLGTAYVAVFALKMVLVLGSLITTWRLGRLLPTPARLLATPRVSVSSKVKPMPSRRSAPPSRRPLICSP